MKKILIALPLVLVMLLSMIPVMAAQTKQPVEVYILEEPNTQKGQVLPDTININIEEDDLKDKAKLEAAVEAFAKTVKMPDDRAYTHKVTVTPAQDAVEAKYAKVTVKALMEQNDKIKLGVAKAEDYVLKARYAALLGMANDYDLKATDVAGENTPADEIAQVQVAAAGNATKAKAEVVFTPKCFSEKKEETKPVCLEPCSEITVVLYDVHNKRYDADFTVVYTVDKNQAPDYQAAINLYMSEEFPYYKYQPLKNYLNVYSILTPKNIEECTIVIEVLPKWEKVQIIHELYDCCITPDGEIKKSLLSSFIEDDEAFAFTGVPDGFMGIPFLEFHTGLMVNQDKAGEYAKTRLEKMNAKDFVFDGAEFFDGIRASNWVKGIKNLRTGEVTTIRNDVPTIVIRYLRAECVKTDEKVDNAKVEAGVQTTTNAPAQQLPATGAKDITAFFMSAVALLGLGIFFAKKH